MKWANKRLFGGSTTESFKPNPPNATVCQSPVNPFSPNFLKRQSPGKFMIYLGHIITSAKQGVNSKTQKQAQCREQEMRGPQSLLHTFRAMRPHLPTWPQPSMYRPLSLNTHPSFPMFFLCHTGSHLQGPGPSPSSPTQAGELLLCFPNSAHLSPRLSPLTSRTTVYQGPWSFCLAQELHACW